MISLSSIGAALTVIGCAYGISTIGKHMDGIARQPEASNKIQTAMIIACALIEGVSLFGVVVALIK